MSNALRNAAESTAHVLSDLVDEARDLVDEAHDRIEDLPPLRARRRNSNRRWIIIVLVAIGAMVLIGRRRHRQHPEVSDSSAGARLMEKSLAVS